MEFRKNFLAIAFMVFAVIIVGCTRRGYGAVVKFDYPDIKNDFCGVHINFQYCKCAFHNDYCDAIGKKKSAANTYVRAEYDKWLAGQLAAFGATCTNKGGIFDKDKCQYCDDGYVVADDICVEKSVVVKIDGPFNSDCSIEQDEFDRDWKKYSDIDEVIPFEERSYEAKQVLTLYETMIAKMLEGFQLDRDMEIENRLQAELTTYRGALVKNIKTNLLKSLWRLAWVTYSTMQSGKGLGESYASILTESASVETIGAGLKVIQGIIPNDSVLAIDTSTITGKVKSVGASAAIEAVGSLGDPVKVATTIFESASNAALPSADITEEEIEILRNQYVKNGVIDQALAASRAANEARAARAATLEQEIAALQTQVSEWEAKEKDRVRLVLEASCQRTKR